MIKISLLFFAFFLFLSCSNKKEPVVNGNRVGTDTLSVDVDNRLHTIDLGSNYHVCNDEMLLSDVVADVEYIKLETRDASLIADITKVEYVNGNLFIQSNSLIYMFDKEGRFIRRIGSIGGGPEEYIQSFDFTADDSLVYVNSRNKICKYRVSDGSFAGGYMLLPPHDDNFQIFSLSNSNIVNVKGVAMIQNSQIGFIRNNKGDSILCKYPDLSSLNMEDLKKARTVSYDPITWPYKDIVNIRDVNSDTVFSVRDSIFYPRFVIDLGKYKMPLRIWYDRKERFIQEPNYIILRTAMETSDYLYMLFNNNDVWNTDYYYFFRYSKPTGEIKVWKKYGEKYHYGFKNDVDGGTGVRVGFQIKGNYVWNAISTTTIDEFLTSEHFEKVSATMPEKKAQLQRLTQLMQPDDNPIIALYKLK